MAKLTNYITNALRVSPGKNNNTSTPLRRMTLLLLYDYFVKKDLSYEDFVNLGVNFFKLQYFTRNLIQDDPELFSIGDSLLDLKNQKNTNIAKERIENYLFKNKEETEKYIDVLLKYKED